MFPGIGTCPSFHAHDVFSATNRDGTLVGLQINFGTVERGLPGQDTLALAAYFTASSRRAVRATFEAKNSQGKMVHGRNLAVLYWQLNASIFMLAFAVRNRVLSIMSPLFLPAV